MIIGFLGKGGSGKSTLSTRMVEFLHAKGNTVLAIDADYNMDLIHNLQVPENINFLGTEARIDLKKYMQVDNVSTYSDIVIGTNGKQYFSIYPPDSFTKKYTLEVKPKLYVMAVGTQSMDVLTDKMCSHGLGAVLKGYLPLLQLQKNEYVVIDEKAGADSVGTGIPTGFNMAVIAVEPTVYGIKAAKQIANLLDHYKVPYIYVINKIKSDTDTVLVEKELGQKAVAYIPFGESIDDEHMERIFDHGLSHIKEKGDNRYSQSTVKFTFNKEYNS